MNGPEPARAWREPRPTCLCSPVSIQKVLFVKDMAMDPIDRKILALLQADASLAIAEIAGQVGLSQTPCWKRIQKLEAAAASSKAGWHCSTARS